MSAESTRRKLRLERVPRASRSLPPGRREVGSGPCPTSPSPATAASGPPSARSSRRPALRVRAFDPGAAVPAASARRLARRPRRRRLLRRRWPCPCRGWARSSPRSARTSRPSQVVFDVGSVKVGPTAVLGGAPRPRRAVGGDAPALRPREPRPGRAPPARRRLPERAAPRRDGAGGGALPAHRLRDCRAGRGRARPRHGLHARARVLRRQGHARRGRAHRSRLRRRPRSRPSSAPSRPCAATPATSSRPSTARTRTPPTRAARCSRRSPRPTARCATEDAAEPEPASLAIPDLGAGIPRARGGARAHRRGRPRPPRAPRAPRAALPPRRGGEGGAGPRRAGPEARGGAARGAAARGRRGSGSTPRASRRSSRPSSASREKCREPDAARAPEAELPPACARACPGKPRRARPARRDNSREPEDACGWPSSSSRPSKSRPCPSKRRTRGGSRTSTAGDMPQLTWRSAITGMLLGGVPLAHQPLHRRAHRLVARRRHHERHPLVRALQGHRQAPASGNEMTLLENNAMQSIATSAGLHELGALLELRRVHDGHAADRSRSYQVDASGSSSSRSSASSSRSR